MKRWLPHPLLSLALLGFWLLLNSPAHLSNWLLGAALALVAPWLARTLIPAGQRPRHLGTAALLVWHVCLDSVVSALVVARQIMQPVAQRPTGQFVPIKLALTNPYALTSLQIITSVTPGTLWCDYDEASGVAVIHVLHVDDEADFIAHFRHRYEQPLQRIFE